MTLFANIAAVSAAMAGAGSNSAKIKTIAKFILAPSVLPCGLFERTSALLFVASFAVSAA
jgi:hypothetical protein